MRAIVKLVVLPVMVMVPPFDVLIVVPEIVRSVGTLLAVMSDWLMEAVPYPPCWLYNPCVAVRKAVISFNKVIELVDDCAMLLRARTPPMIVNRMARPASASSKVTPRCL